MCFWERFISNIVEPVFLCKVRSRFGKNPAHAFGRYINFARQQIRKKTITMACGSVETIERESLAYVRPQAVG